MPASPYCAFRVGGFGVFGLMQFFAGLVLAMARAGHSVACLAMW